MGLGVRVRVRGRVWLGHAPYLLVLTILQLLGKCLEAAAGRGAVNRRLLCIPHGGAALARLEAAVGVIALVTWLGLGLGLG